jgi:hypothetical protein
MMSLPEEMYSELEKEMKLRRLDSIQETIRQLISNYLRDMGVPKRKIIPL